MFSISRVISQNCKMEIVAYIPHIIVETHYVCTRNKDERFHFQDPSVLSFTAFICFEHCSRNVVLLLSNNARHFMLSLNILLLSQNRRKDTVTYMHSHPTHHCEDTLRLCAQHFENLEVLSFTSFIHVSSTAHVM